MKDVIFISILDMEAFIFSKDVLVINLSYSFFFFLRKKQGY